MSPATQVASSVKLSLPTSRLTSGIAVMSLNPSVLIPNPPAAAETPASAEIPTSAERPASAEIPASVASNLTSRILAPPTQYVQTGGKAPKLSVKPSRQEVQRVTETLLSNGTPFRPVGVVFQEKRSKLTTLLKLRFATDPERRDKCSNWNTWSNQRFCRELGLAVPDNAISRSDKLGFVESVSQIQLQFDIEKPAVEEKTDHQLAEIVETFPDATPHFIAEVIKEFLALIGCQHCLTLAYSKKKIISLNV